uniref:Uncharacterized protein n=1 Tax=Arundo donax TaxID=35708 RepID=A0A0A8Z126_ARUDO
MLYLMLLFSRLGNLSDFTNVEWMSNNNTLLAAMIPCWKHIYNKKP